MIYVFYLKVSMIGVAQKIKYCGAMVQHRDQFVWLVLTYFLLHYFSKKSDYLYLTDLLYSTPKNVSLTSATVEWISERVVEAKDVPFSCI